VDFKTIKEAVVYGNVMGSFAVEDFGVRKLLAITRNDVEERYERYRKLIQFYHSKCTICTDKILITFVRDIECSR